MKPEKVPVIAGGSVVLVRGAAEDSGFSGREQDGFSGAAQFSAASVGAKEDVYKRQVRVAPCGGVDRRLLLAQEVVIHGSRPVPGIVGTKPPHLTSGDEAKKVVDIEEIAIDTGYSREELLQWVAPGDRVTYVSAFAQLENGRVTSRSLDDRAGAAAILHALELLKDKPLACSLTVVFSSQEETGGLGAATTAFRVKPDACLLYTSRCV